MNHQSKCSRCKELKPLTDFHKDKSRKNGVQRYCKECKKKMDLSGYGRYRGRYVVYYLPKHHYVGMTKHYSKRIRRHRSNKKDVSGHTVLLVTRSQKIAHLVESLLHLFGFKGFRY